MYDHTLGGAVGIINKINDFFSNRIKIYKDIVSCVIKHNQNTLDIYISKFLEFYRDNDYTVSYVNYDGYFEDYALKSGIECDSYEEENSNLRIFITNVDDFYTKSLKYESEYSPASVEYSIPSYGDSNDNVGTFKGDKLLSFITTLQNALNVINSKYLFNIDEMKRFLTISSASDLCNKAIEFVDQLYIDNSSIMSIEKIISCITEYISAIELIIRTMTNYNNEQLENSGKGSTDVGLDDDSPTSPDIPHVSSDDASTSTITRPSTIKTPDTSTVKKDESSDIKRVTYPQNDMSTTTTNANSTSDTSSVKTENNDDVTPSVFSKVNLDNSDGLTNHVRSSIAKDFNKTGAVSVISTSSGDTKKVAHVTNDSSNYSEKSIIKPIVSKLITNKIIGDSYSNVKDTSAQNGGVILGTVLGLGALTVAGVAGAKYLKDKRNEENYEDDFSNENFNFQNNIDSDSTANATEKYQASIFNNLDVDDSDINEIPKYADAFEIENSITSNVNSNSSDSVLEFE